MKTCETCNAFQTQAQKDPAKPNDAIAGECRAESPKILATYNTPQGTSWTAGWPPTMSGSWCRAYQAKFSVARPTALLVGDEP